MTLDAEIAERLSIDAALGHLSPDVQALWQAYVDQRPELARRARLDRDTVSRARQALAADAPAGPTELPNRTVVPLRRRVDPARLARWASAIAAGLVVGLALGQFVVPGPATPPASQPQTDVVSIQVQPPPPSSSDTDQDDRFWSTRRLYRQLAGQSHDQSEPPNRGTGRVIWESPLRPRIEGKEL